MSDKKISNRELFISLIISLGLFISWIIYREHFDINISHTILTDELKDKKIKVISLTIPIFKNRVDIIAYSESKLCRKYLKNDIKLLLEHKRDNFALNGRRVLYNLDYGDLVKVKISTQKELKSCSFKIESLATKGDILLAVVFGYGAFMLFIFTLFILLYRWLIS